MGEYKSTIITKKAHDLIAKLIASTADIEFTRVCASSKDYSSLDNAQLEKLTEIEEIKQETLVSSTEYINNANVNVNVAFDNLQLTEGYYMKTIALYANDNGTEILYSVTPSNIPNYMPPFNGKHKSDATFDLITVVSNADNVQINVNPSAHITSKVFNDFKNEVNSQLNDKANKNLIINGEPLIWQRGTSLVNIQDFCADRWLYVCWASSSASGKIEKDFDGSMKMTDFNTTGNYIQQIIETSTSEKLANKKITLSADIKANNINTGNIYIQLVFSNGVDKIDYSGIVTHQELVIAHSDITSDYKRFKLTVDVPDTTKTISVQIGSHSTLGEVVNNDCILNIRNIKLELGTYETQFVPQLYSEELALCKRYYQEVAAVILQATFNDMREMALQSEMIEMRIKPTILNVCGVNGANESMWTIQKVGVGDIGIDKTNSTFVLFNKSLLYCILKDGNNNPVGNNNTDLYTAYLKLDSEIR